MTTVLTREYLDVRPDGWLDYAAKRTAQLGVDKCYNRTLCDELLSIVLPAKPPFHPRQFATCAVVDQQLHGFLPADSNSDFLEEL
ncbi:Sialyltransferase-like protein 1 [Zea mays]|nr:Sialyltransferase-like protein 1 [Zea mays]